MSASSGGAKQTARKRHRFKRATRLALGLLSATIVSSIIVSFVIFERHNRDTGSEPQAQAEELNDVGESEELQIPIERQQVTTAVSSFDRQLRYFEPQLRLTQDDLRRASQREPFKRLLEANSSQLLHLTDLKFPVEPDESKNMIECDLESRGGQRTLYIVINSRNSNFKRRRRLRSSWANVAHIKQQLCPSASEWGAPSDDELGGADSGSPRASFIATSGRAKGAAPEVAINQYLASHKKGAQSVGERARIGRVELLFVLAQSRQDVDTLSMIAAAGRQQTEPRVAREAAANGDLLVANLAEHYHNITLKHLAIYKWLLSRATAPTNQSLERGRGPRLDPLVLKCDDDVQLDLEQLLEKLLEEAAPAEAPPPPKEGEQKRLDKSVTEFERPVLMCAQFPQNSLVQRRRRTKWQLSAAEWPFDTFPAYCSGLAYLSSLELVRALYLVAHMTQLAGPLPPLWIDDVYVTGVLLAALEPSEFQLIKLNPYFCYTRAQRERRQLELGQRCMAAELD